MIELHACVYFTGKYSLYLHFSTGNGQPGVPALCQLYRHTFVPYSGRRGGATSDLRSRGRQFDPQPGCHCVCIRRLWASCSHSCASTPTVFLTTMESLYLSYFHDSCPQNSIVTTPNICPSVSASIKQCTQVRKTTHGLDGQHQDVDRTRSGRVSQNDRGQG